MSFTGRLGVIVARKWVAGTTIPDAISRAKQLNGLKEKATINYLGEALTNKAAVQEEVTIYLNILKAMKTDRISGNIAVKPTQLGLGINYALFLSNYDSISEAAHKLGIFVWLDMEESEYISDTIKGYISILKKRKNVGICQQARVIRAFDDIKPIVKQGGIVRLVKGAYTPKQGINYMTKEDTDANYLRCMEYLFKNSRSFMIATHDDKLINKAMEFQKRYKRRLMFAMLLGIRPKLARQIAEDGNDIYIYLPFGEHWIEYGIRRIREAGHAILILRSIFQG